MTDGVRGAALADLQHGFAAAVRAAGDEPLAGLEARIVPGGELDAAGALAVYRSGYVARLAEQLGETYATVWWALGDDAFFELCRGYVAAHPSSSYNLSDYGRDFPAWLGSSPWALSHPFLEELAMLEAGFHQLFHGHGHVAASVERAAQIAARGDLRGVKLRFGEAMRLFVFARAVHELFRHRDRDAAPDVDIERPQWILLFRDDGDVRAVELDEGTYVALDAMRGGAAVDEALGLAQTRDAAFDGARASALFALLVSSGIVAEWID